MGWTDEIKLSEQEKAQEELHKLLFEKGIGGREKAIRLCLYAIGAAYKAGIEDHLFLDLLNASFEVIRQASELETVKFLQGQFERADKKVLTKENLLHDLTFLHLKVFEKLIEAVGEMKKLAQLLDHETKTKGSQSDASKETTR